MNTTNPNDTRCFLLAYLTLVGVLYALPALFDLVHGL